jgi:hypothetical protein
MKSKDQILLESIYERIILKENEQGIKLYKGYIFPDGQIFNDCDHADAWDSIPKGMDSKHAIKYIATLGSNPEVILQGKLNKSIADTFARYGVEPQNIRYGSVDDEMKVINQQVIDKKLSELSNNFIDVGGGYKARLRKYKGGERLYTHFRTPEGDFYEINGGISPNDIKFYGGFENLVSDKYVKKMDKYMVLGLFDKFVGDNFSVY